MIVFTEPTHAAPTLRGAIYPGGTGTDWKIGDGIRWCRSQKRYLLAIAASANRRGKQAKGPLPGCKGTGDVVSGEAISATLGPACPTPDELPDA